MAKKPKGIKFDSKKPRWELLPMELIEEAVMVLTSALAKYEPDNWKYVKDRENRYYAALMRHIVAWRKGEKKDKESGLSHLAHALCCLVFLQWGENDKKEK